MSETDLVSAVLRALSLEPGITAWRNNVGEARVHGAHVRYGLGVGSADIIGLLWGSGRFFALECKTERGKLRVEQILWGRRVQEFGGHYAVVRSVEEAVKEVRQQRAA